jgi:hypothetical protein
MGKRALKMRIKQIHPYGFAVQQRFRQHQIISWKTLDTFNTLEECVTEYPYLGVEKSARKLGLSVAKIVMLTNPMSEVTV